MKRKGNIYDKIYSIENLMSAEKKARKGKKNQHGVKVFDKNPEKYLIQLQQSLINKTYKTSEYKTEVIFEKKERIIYKLPYFPDRICHHAIMNQLESIFIKSFVADTYSCIKGRGIHKASFQVRKALKDTKNTQFCLKLDIKSSIHLSITKYLKSFLEGNLKIKTYYGY